MTAVQDEVMREYLGECQETVERLGMLLGKLEKDPTDGASIREICRGVHTIKGSSQLFGFHRIGDVAHAIENCLENIQCASNAVLPKLIEDLYLGFDFINKSLDMVRHFNKDPEHTDQVQALLRSLSSIAVSVPKQSQEATLAPVKNEDSKSLTADEGHPDTIRVQVELLDSLMNLVGELVLVRNQILQVANQDDNDELYRSCQRLNVISGELQSQVMKTRMQPISHVMNKFHRLVRDASRDLQKQIEIHLEGSETELDKTLIEAVRDPLTHIIRNAVDHGIETQDERMKAGKSDKARIVARAFHESGHVIIEVSDDGRGLSREKISKKIIASGLQAPEQVARMSDRDIFSHIFMPGFSTAEKVSTLSGRGVGMDIAKTNIERIGGAVELDSTLGVGTRISLRIPLTLAIIPALIVHVGKERFAIPQVKLVELIRVDNDDAHSQQVEFLHDQPVLRLRGKILPLVCLKQVLDGQEGKGFDLDNASCINIAVLNADRLVFGLIVEGIEDTVDIVVKPIANFIKDIGVFSGASIMGDGGIALTLDVLGLAERAGARVSDYSKSSPDLHHKVAKIFTSEYLLLDLGHTCRYALPLNLVTRLEEFSADQIKISCDQRVVSYRGSLLPIIEVNDFLRLPSEKASTGTMTHVVVVTSLGRAYGLRVERILDVIATSGQVDEKIRDRQGLMGALIDGEEVIPVLDVLQILSGTIIGANGMSDQKSAHELREQREKHCILIADDATFARIHLSEVLTTAGYRIAAMKDGQGVFDLLMNHKREAFSLIVSDIEMPDMDGLELAGKIRANSTWRDIPIFALTSRFHNTDIKAGIDAGFTRYFSKLKTDDLLQEIDTTLSIISQKDNSNAA